MSNIKFVKGNAVDALLNGEIDFLLNQVNCQGVYASGIAKEIGGRIPDAKEEYHSYINHPYVNRNQILGDVVVTESGVVHIFSQEFYGRGGKRYTNYGALAKGLSNLLFRVYYNTTTKCDTVIGIPDMIGCGLGGGDREIVLELIEHLLSWAKEVRIYQLEGK